MECVERERFFFFIYTNVGSGIFFKLKFCKYNLFRLGKIRFFVDNIPPWKRHDVLLSKM